MSKAKINLEFPQELSKIAINISKNTWGYSDLGEDNYSQDDYSSFIAYSAYNFDEDYISISAYADPETKKIIEYSYSTDKTLE